MVTTIITFNLKMNQQLDQIIHHNHKLFSKLEELIVLLKTERKDWVDTKSALILLRRKNPRIMTTIRTNFLSHDQFRKEGKNYEYLSSALMELRNNADKGKIMIPKK